MKRRGFGIILGLCLFFGTTHVRAELSVGGIIFLDTYYYVQADKNWDLRLEVPTTTRFRARWTNEDSLGAYIEIGLGGGRGGVNVKLRHAYAVWNISKQFQLLVGQTSTPFSPLSPSQLIGNSSGQDHIIGYGYGNINGSRQPQIRFTYKFHNKRGAFVFAIAGPNGGSTVDLDGSGDTDNETKNGKVPRFDLAVAFRFYDVQLFASGYFQYQTYRERTANRENAIWSWGTSLGFKWGIKFVTISGEFTAGQNTANTRNSSGKSPAAKNAGAWTSVTNAGKLRLDHALVLAGWGDIAFNFAFSKLAMGIHLIGGAMHDLLAGNKPNITSYMLGISLPVDFPVIAKGLRIRPEFFYYHNGNSVGAEMIGGVQFQYTF